MQVRGWPWITLLACVAATGNAAAQAVAPSDAGHLPPGEPAAETDSHERDWRLPPLRITGSLSYDYRGSRSSDEGNSSAHLVSGTIGTSTYIYQPWFATLSGALGLTSSWSQNAAGGLLGSPFNDAQVHDKIRGQEQFITGNARLNLFPRSRFPTDIHFDRQDSRVDAGLASSIDFQRQSFGVTQRYRPENGAYNVNASFNHTTQNGLGFRSSEDSLSGDFTTRWKFNDLALGASYSRARNESADDDSRFTSLVARHTYAPNSALSINSSGNFTRTEERGLLSSDLQVLQLSSVGLYHADRSPLTLTGSLRGITLRADGIGDTTSTVGATVGANYEVNPNLRLSASGGASMNNGGAGSGTAFSGSLGASYQGDAIEFRNINYNWFAAGTVAAASANGSTGEGDSQASVNLQLGHSATRAWRITPESNFALTAGQTLSATEVRDSRNELSGTGLGSSKTLLNTIAATWQANGDGRSAYVRASYNDSAELGGGHARFQLLNVQLSGNMELGYGRTLAGDFTYQRSMQRASDFTLTSDPLFGSGIRTRTRGASGEITFRQNQLFGVPRLRFVSRLMLAQDVLKQPGQLLSFPDRETRLWENRLDWNIGRLETQAILRFSRIDGRRVDSLWLRVQRNFGD
jgi:hypothetical protein